MCLSQRLRNVVFSVIVEASMSAILPAVDLLSSCCTAFQTTRTSTMTFYGDAPGLRVPELIALFSNKELKALNLHFLQRPQQFAWLLDFQRNQLQAGLTATQKIRYFEFLGPISTTTSRSNPVPPWPSRR